jgi:hypothetical protein
VPPRLLNDFRGLRGHELEAWILIYGPLVLEDFMNDEQYLILLMFSAGLYWLTVDDGRGRGGKGKNHVEYFPLSNANCVW